MAWRHTAQPGLESQPWGSHLYCSHYTVKHRGPHMLWHMPRLTHDSTSHDPAHLTAHSTVLTCDTTCHSSHITVHTMVPTYSSTRHCPPQCSSSVLGATSSVSLHSAAPPPYPHSNSPSHGLSLGTNGHPVSINLSLVVFLDGRAKSHLSVCLSAAGSGLAPLPTSKEPDWQA